MEGCYPIIEIDAGDEIPESVGTKEKFWIEHESQLHLLKFGREGTGENWSEKAACEIARLLQIPHAQYELCLFGGRYCTISRSILKTNESLVLGNEIFHDMESFQNSARTYRQKIHTIGRVQKAIVQFATPDPNESWHRFIGYLMLDALIGNTDRHYENWGMVRGENASVFLAPTFDHASCLGRELSDEKRIGRLETKDSRYSVQAYAERTKSALFREESHTKPMSPIDAFYEAAKTKPESGVFWLEQLKKISSDHFVQILDKIPESFMSRPSAKFALAILETNRMLILSKWNSHQ